MNRELPPRASSRRLNAQIVSSSALRLRGVSARASSSRHAISTSTRHASLSTATTACTGSAPSSSAASQHRSMKRMMPAISASGTSASAGRPQPYALKVLGSPPLTSLGLKLSRASSHARRAPSKTPHATCTRPSLLASSPTLDPSVNARCVHPPSACIASSSLQKCLLATAEALSRSCGGITTSTPSALSPSRPRTRRARIGARPAALGHSRERNRTKHRSTGCARAAALAA